MVRQFHCKAEYFYLSEAAKPNHRATRRRAGVSRRREPGDPWQQSGHGLAVSDVYTDVNYAFVNVLGSYQQTENVGT